MPLIFSFTGIEQQGHNFQCSVNCKQCSATCKNGTTCKNRVCIGTPKCWVHLLKEHNLRIKASGINGAGAGLFAMKHGAETNDVVFKKDDVIIKYLGETITPQILFSRYREHTAPYTLQMKKDVYVDAACERGAGALANHAASSNSNAKFAVRGKGASMHLAVVAIKNIKHGTEILVNYGREYIVNEPNVDFKTTRKRQ